MVWVKLDDKFHSNEKVLEAGYPAAGLYAMSLAYCGDHLTDGRVPDAWANQHPKALRDKLAKAGLWKKMKGGYQIPDFTELNPSKADVDARRAKQREGGLKGAAARWKADGSTHSPTHGSTLGGTQAEPKRPDPSPIPKGSNEPPKPRATAKPFKCRFCSYDFVREQAYIDHEWYVHGIDPDTRQPWTKT